jgi:hypothetical protein
MNFNIFATNKNDDNFNLKAARYLIGKNIRWQARSLHQAKWLNKGLQL